MKAIIMISCCVFSFIFMKIVNAASINSILPDRYDGLPDDCLLPMDFGYCRAKVKRYYFDIRRMKCSMFFWGGCAGNANNFASMEECQDLCFAEHQPEPKKNSFGKGAVTLEKTPSNNNDRVAVRQQNSGNTRKSDNVEYDDYDSK